MNANSEPPAAQPRGAALLITGLPAAGKTTLGTALAAHIENHFGRKVTLLDGDEARKLLSSELGYSRGHRRLNVLRHGFELTVAEMVGAVTAFLMRKGLLQDKGRS